MRTARLAADRIAHANRANQANQANQSNAVFVCVGHGTSGVVDAGASGYVPSQRVRHRERHFGHGGEGHARHR